MVLYLPSAQLAATVALNLSVAVVAGSSMSTAWLRAGQSTWSARYLVRLRALAQAAVVAAIFSYGMVLSLEAAAWQQASAAVAIALGRVCGLGGSCGLAERYDEYVAEYMEVRRLDNAAGDWNGAVAASLGTVSAVFEQFSADSKELADQYTAAAITDLASSGDGLPPLRLVVLFAGLAVAALALAGYGQRLREYR